MNWLLDYIGKPWVQGKNGPEGFYCWGLVQAVYRDRWSKALPDFEMPEWRPRVYAETFITQTEARDNWQQMPSARQGDVVLLGRNRVITHCGLWVGPQGYYGRVLHCIEPSQKGKLGSSGVVCQSLQAIRQHGWGRIEFYRHKDFLECLPQ